ncbi:hypothetical protein POSPLADRAFT_1034192 [Postia placenta MAD-698-R-SB12]|uniref:Uncharacterized protein n=1 Tax=Postia placenta MAD-698-R-SB12 TaxID=670580 RepID=A0A1X6MZG8_9APHY|nr:hypothetical protein POSPLADRAFT_1034192 [Postia placenta MAD-698-R-SB12]OSX61616.1 hypothetical protein POSPLADRAFT_1034192 [Postia placenta MAD-698-R-SB12]
MISWVVAVTDMKELQNSRFASVFALLLTGVNSPGAASGCQDVISDELRCVAWRRLFRHTHPCAHVSLQVSKNLYTGQLLSILHVTLWAAIIKGISGISQDSQAFDMASIVCAHSMMLASVMLVAYVASVIAQRKEDDEIEEEYSNSLQKLLNQRAHVLLAVWISSILANMPPFVASQPRHVLIFACPVIQHWVQYSIIHRCVANGTHLRALQAMGESRDSIARSCCRVRESLRAKAPFGRESAPDVEVIALEPIQL